MSVAFAAIEAQVGAATLAAFGNATATLAGQGPVDGIYTRAAAMAGIGAAGMAARDTTFVCPTSALEVPVAKGTAISIAYAATGAPAAYKVFKRQDSLEAGQTTLVLEAA